MNKKVIKSFSPPNLGWLEYKLTSKEMDYVWRCIENKKDDCKNDLAGNISSSYSLIDRGDWFWLNVITPLIRLYNEQYLGLGKRIPINNKHPYYMKDWWVNYQKQNEFNPLHEHTGVYSFVLWMKIPFDWNEQNKKDIAKDSISPKISTFQFSYSTTIGNHHVYEYELSSEDEGTMLFFPAQLPHQVYPFYDCDEDRISISGNIMLDTSRRL